MGESDSPNRTLRRLSKLEGEGLDFIAEKRGLKRQDLELLGKVAKLGGDERVNSIRMGDFYNMQVALERGVSIGEFDRLLNEYGIQANYNRDGLNVYLTPEKDKPGFLVVFAPIEG